MQTRNAFKRVLRELVYKPRAKRYVPARPDLCFDRSKMWFQRNLQTQNFIIVLKKVPCFSSCSANLSESFRKRGEMVLSYQTDGEPAKISELCTAFAVRPECFPSNNATLLWFSDTSVIVKQSYSILLHINSSNNIHLHQMPSRRTFAPLAGVTSLFLVLLEFFISLLHSVCHLAVTT